MHLKSTAGCQISTLIFEFCGGPYRHLGFKSKVLPGPLSKRIFLVLRHISLLVASLVAARNWSLA